PLYPPPLPAPPAHPPSSTLSPYTTLFRSSIMGSSVYAGLFDLDEMLAVTDLEGTSVAEALEAIGYDGTDIPPEAISYAEIHIEQDRKSTRLNSSHVSISYAVFCLKKNKDK